MGLQVLGLPETGEVYGVNCICRIYGCMGDIHDLRKRFKRQRRQTMLAKEIYARLMGEAERVHGKDVYREKQGLPRAAEDSYFKRIQSKSKSCMYYAGLRMQSMLRGLHGLFTSEPLNNFPLVISKILMKTIVPYLSSHIFFDEAVVHVEKWPTLIQRQKEVLYGCNAYHTEIERNGGGALRRVDFSKGDASSDLNWLVTIYGLVRILKRKDYRPLDMVFPFVEGFIARGTGLAEQAPLTGWHTMYFHLVDS